MEGKPSTSSSSLTPRGRPASGPGSSPRAMRSPMARASARACSGRMAMKALSTGFVSSMRARQASMSSTGESPPDRTWRVRS